MEHLCKVQQCGEVVIAKLNIDVLVCLFPVFGVFFCSLGFTWGSSRTERYLYTRSSPSHNRGKAREHLGSPRDMGTQVTDLCQSHHCYGKSIYYIHKTPVTLHRARTRISYNTN